MSKVGQIAMMASLGALVVTEKDINESGDENGRYIHLKGRKAGLISAIMSHLGLDTTTIFDVYADRIEFTSSSLSGHVDELIPMASVCNLGTGFVKPVGLIFVGIIVLLSCIGTAFAGGGWVAFIVGLVFAIACFVFYKLGRTVMVYARTVGADVDMISFKKSVVEGISMSPDEAARVIAIMSTLVQNASAKKIDQKE